MKKFIKTFENWSLNEKDIGELTKLNDEDKNKFYDTLNGYLEDEFELESSEEKNSFLNNLISGENIHIHPGKDHWEVAFTHLGKRHNIEVDVGGHYPFAHNEKPNNKISIEPDSIFNASVVIPIGNSRNSRSKKRGGGMRL